MNEKDMSPIDQRWIKQYVDAHLEGAEKLSDGPFKDAILRRIECVMDLVETWQTRNHPRPKVTYER